MTEALLCHLRFRKADFRHGRFPTPLETGIRPLRGVVKPGITVTGDHGQRCADPKGKLRVKLLPMKRTDESAYIHLLVHGRTYTSAAIKSGQTRYSIASNCTRPHLHRSSLMHENRSPMLVRSRKSFKCMLTTSNRQR
jgi:hypothetical protein